MSLIGINGRFLLKPYTGIGQYSQNLLRALTALDQTNQYLVVVPEPVSLTFGKNVTLKILPEVAFGSAGFKKTWWEQIQIAKFFRQQQISLAHFFYPANPWSKVTWPSLVTVHDTIPWELAAYTNGFLSRLYQTNALRNLKKVNHIITVSQSVKNKLQKLMTLPDNRISLVYNAAAPIFSQPCSQKNLSEVKKKYGLKPAFILYVGGYDERKNVTNLVKAYTKYIAPHYPIDLIMVGAKALDKPLYRSFDYVLASAKNVSISSSGHIRVLGLIDENELKSLYHLCHFFVNVSREEGFNIPVVEAASAQAAILLSDIPVHQEIAGSSANYCQLDIPSIATGLKKMITDDKLRSDLKQRSGQLAQKYNWEKAAAQVLEIYKKMLAS